MLAGPAPCSSAGSWRNKVLAVAAGSFHTLQSCLHLALALAARNGTLLYIYCG